MNAHMATDDTAGPLDAEPSTSPTVTAPPEAIVLAGLTPGDRVGRYQIKEVLGAGAMGVVYRARDTQLARDVALKVLHPHRDRDPARVEHHGRLLREAQALAKLSHPNVVAVHDVGTHDGAVFVAMELAPGASLRTWLAGTTSRRTILRALVDAGRGLAAAHSAGVIHRDMKPDNIVVAPDGRAQVVDFGLARGERDVDETPVVSTTGEHPPAPTTSSGSGSGSLLGSELTAPGVRMGTPGYMAPEQLDGKADARADQFGFAATAFRALTGDRPYKADTLDGYRAAIRGATRTPWPSTIPRRLRRVIDRGLAIRPEDRYASMARFVGELERAVDAPRRLVARLATGAAGAGVAAVIAWAVLANRGAAPSCASEDAAFAGVWDDARKAELARVFTATGAPHAADTTRRVHALLDGYTSAWRGMRREACVATRTKKTQSELVHALRDACLDQRRAAVTSLVDVLAKVPAGDADGIDKAISAVRRLEPLADCADTTQLLGEEGRMPSAPERKAAVTLLERRLGGLRALSNTGETEAALAMASQLRDDVRADGYAPLLARVTLELGILQRASGERADGTVTIEDALAQAGKAVDARGVADAAIALFHAAIVDGRPEDARAMLPLVDAAVHGAGDRPHQRMRIHIDRAVTETAAQDYPAATASLDAAAAVCATLPDNRELCAIEIARERGFTALDAQQNDVAIAALRDVLERSREVYGPLHPIVLMAANNLANTIGEGGDREAALAVLAESKAIVATMPGSNAAAYVLFAEGFIWQNSGDCAAAIALYEQALAQMLPLLGARSNDVIVAHQRIGNCMVKVGRTADALPHLEEWVAAREEVRARPAWQAEGRFALARALWDTGSRARAVVEATKALDLYREEADRAGPEIEAVTAWLGAHR
jgi:eukaryotic-like serine/threonine-protein kinase